MSSPLSRENILHTAKLARIELSDAELDSFEIQMPKILEAFDGLQKIDTAGVAEMHQVTGLSGVMAEDKVKQIVDREDMLRTSNQKLKDHQIVVPSPHGTNG
jgi:aspartyl-tRNA(Asn)/glutamyl-tRNA(Gln) amidotransferase subunit C